MKRPTTVSRNRGKRITQWKFLVQTTDEKPDEIIFDVLMIENFSRSETEPPSYQFCAELATTNTPKNIQTYENLKRRRDSGLQCDTLPELYKIVEAAAAKFENLEWKKIIVVGFDWVKGSHEEDHRSYSMADNPGRKGFNTEIQFDFMVGEQAGVWFRSDGERLEKSASCLLSGFSCNGECHVLPYDDVLLARLIMLRECFHSLAAEITKLLKPDKIRDFLAALENKQGLLTEGLSK